MTHIGVLGLDTSHPETFARTLARTDAASITAVWDSGAVRGRSSVDRFCDEFGAVPVEDPTAMIDLVDAVMVCSVDWDAHATLAVPFLDAGIPTFVDKPIAGSLQDVEALAAAATSAPLFGGSAVPFHPAFDDLPAPTPDRSFMATGFNDSFYYGAHLVDLVRSLTSGDWIVVRPASAPGKTVTVVFDDGSAATLRFDAPRETTKYAVLDVTDSARTAQVPMEDEAKPRMYAAFLDAFLETVAGDRDDTRRILDGATLLLAANLSLELGRPVTPDSDALAEAHVDGGLFETGYAAMVNDGAARPAAQWVPSVRPST